MGIRERRWTSAGKQRRAWVVDYTGRDDKRHIKTFSTRSAADRFWARHLALAPPREAIYVVRDWLRVIKDSDIGRAGIAKMVDEGLGRMMEWPR